MNRKNLLCALLGMGVLLFLFVACGPQATPTARTSIGGIAFTADRTSLQPGECTTLRWEATVGFGATLDTQPVDKIGQREVCPAETRAYTLAVDRARTSRRGRRQHAAEYGLDPAHFGALGESSGGHLAALLGVSQGVAELEGTANPGVSDAVQAVAGWYGPVDVTQGPVVFQDNPCTTPPETLIKNYGGEETPLLLLDAGLGNFPGRLPG